MRHRYIAFLLLAWSTLLRADEQTFGIHRVVTRDFVGALTKKLKDEDVHIDPSPQITSRDIERAFVIAVQGGFEVALEFTPEGSTRFTAFTTQCVGSRTAIVVEGILVSSPLISQPISGGAANISGSFSIDEAGFKERDLLKCLGNHIFLLITLSVIPLSGVTVFGLFQALYFS
jgi:hypothetical protein